MPKSARNNLTEEEFKQACYDDIQMRAAERLYSIVTTEINDAKNLTKSFLYEEEIGYALEMWNNSSDNGIRSIRQPTISSLNGDMKFGIKIQKRYLWKIVQMSQTMWRKMKLYFQS